jgi:hypothetical protein
VIGDAPAGALNHDLRQACLDALALKREDALSHAQKFSWAAATEQFLKHLHPQQKDPI